MNANREEACLRRNGKTGGKRAVFLDAMCESAFGLVYVAEQTEPVRRHVAFKVIKIGMDTSAVMVRFEAERSIRVVSKG